MDEKLSLEIKAYEEFLSVFAKYATGLEGIARMQQATAASAETLNQAIAELYSSVQRTGPPLDAVTKATREKTAADREGAEAVRKTSEATKGKSTADVESTEAARRAKDEAKAKAQADRDAADAAKRVKDAAKEKARADKEAADAAHEHKNQVDSLLQGLAALGILNTVKRGLQEVTTVGGAFDRELGIMRGLTGEASDAARDYVMDLDGVRRGVTELTTGLNELARSGYGASDSMEALPDITQFAQAGLQGMEKAAAPLLTTLKAFGMEVKRTGEVADVLTMAANRSALGFDDFQLGLAMSAGAAKLAGQDYTELIAVLSVLRDAGLGASDAGTSIKSAWIALMNPTEEAKRVMADMGIAVYDAQGRMKSWADIVESTERALRPYNEQSRNLALTTIFGSDGIRAMALSMGRGSEYVRALTADLKSSQGAAAALANEMGNTFTGAMERTQANMEKLTVTVFEDLRGGLSGILEAVDTLIVGFNSLDPAARGVIEVLVGGAGLIAAIGSVALLAKTTLIPMLQALPALFTSTAASATATGAAVSAMAGGIGIAVAVVAALTVGIMAWVGAQEKARQEEVQHARSLQDLTGRYDDLQKVIDDGTKSADEHKQATDDQKRVIEQIGNEFPHLVTEWDNHGKAVELNTRLLRENAEAARETARAQDQAAVEKTKAALRILEESRKTLETQISQASEPLTNTQRGLFAKPSGMGFGDQSMFAQPVDELKRDLAEVNRQIATTEAEYRKLMAILYPDVKDPLDQPIDDSLRTQRDLPTPLGGDGKQAYDPKAAAEAEAAEKARQAAIKEQLDLLRHLMTMDDARVDTMAEQLAWLEQIKSTLGSTRDLEEAMYELQKQIAREPLQQQLQAFEQRQRLGEVNARQEQQFYESLLQQADELHLTEQERADYQVRAALARRQAEKDLHQLILDDYRDQVEMNDLTTAQQVSKLDWTRKLFAEGSEERKALDLEYNRLSRQLQEEDHDRKLQEIEFDSIMGRWTNDQKLQALRDYLDREKNLTIEQKRDLQTQVAQMEQQAERDHQNVLLNLLRDGLEAQRKLQEAELRKRHKDAQDAVREDLAETKADYDARLATLNEELQTLQDQSRELERQNRLLELQDSIGKVDAELTNVRGTRNRVVIDPTTGLPTRTIDTVREGQLLDERAQLEKAYADEQDRQDRERAQKSLQAQITELQKEREAKLAELNRELSDLQAAQGLELEAFNVYWTDRLSTQSLNQALEMQNWQTHYADVLADTEQWVRDMNEAYAKLQQPKLDKGSGLAKELGGNGTVPGGTQNGATTQTGTGAGGDTNVEVNNYGTNNYNGVDGVEEAAESMIKGFKGKIR